MTKTEQQINDLAEKLAAIELSLANLRSSLPFLLRSMTEWKREEQRSRVERIGRFTLGQHVCWKENRHKRILEGTIVAIVPPRKYPTHPSVVNTLEVSMESLRYRGYYRYEESYLIQDKRGKLYWPRVAFLTPIKR
jgi:hypothetical protein